MTDRAGFFAGCADTLTAMCVYYVVAGILVMSGRGWGLHLFWLLACAIGCAWIFAALLKKPRGVPFLAAVTGGLFLAVMAVFLLASATPPRFGYVFVLAIGGGMAVGLPLYYGLIRPRIHRHLTHLDVLLMALLGLMLCREALGIDGGTVALMVIVVLLDAAGAVGLRMSDGGGHDSENALRASLIALGAAAALAVVIGLFTAIFSRSAGLTGRILRGIGDIFAAIGGGLERFFLKLFSLFVHKDKFEAVSIDWELPDAAAIEGVQQSQTMALNTTAMAIGIAAVVLLAAIILAVALRKKRLVRGTNSASGPSHTVVRRTSGAAHLWQALMARLRFRWTAFVRRDTPAGLMVLLERLGKRAHTPRRAGETMAHYIRRMDASGGLDELSEALNRQYYGGAGRTLSHRRCRQLRKYMRKAVRYG